MLRIPSLAMLALALLVASVTVARGAEIEGSIAPYDHRGKALAVSRAQESVVYFHPAAGGRAAEPGRHVIATEDKRFKPRVLPVTVGSTVRFPNADPILHNVFSVSPGNAFDVGLYGEGDGVARVFETAGVVRLFCNVHHSMVAYLVVLDTPYFTRPGPDGRFRLSDLPAGSGKLTVWHEGAESWTRQVELPHDSELDIRIDITQRRVPRHLNKLGEPYRRSRDRYE